MFGFTYYERCSTFNFSNYLFGNRTKDLRLSSIEQRECGGGWMVKYSNWLGFYHVSWLILWMKCCNECMSYLWYITVKPWPCATPVFPPLSHLINCWHPLSALTALLIYGHSFFKPPQLPAPTLHVATFPQWGFPISHTRDCFDTTIIHSRQILASNSLSFIYKSTRLHLLVIPESSAHNELHL